MFKTQKLKLPLLLTAALILVSFLAPAVGMAQVEVSDTPEEPVYVENDCRSVAEEPDASGELQSTELNQDNCGIIKYIVIITNILAALVGIVVAASIIIAGIQYSSAGSDPQKVSAAKDRIRNAVIALLFFIFGYGLLNYLVPGGLIG